MTLTVDALLTTLGEESVIATDAKRHLVLSFHYGCFLLKQEGEIVATGTHRTLEHLVAAYNERHG